ncbi:nicotinate-nucleotide adenylyltransferase [bacterium]|nr:nicotinate-nucleotide adenylyltransferase [bacterium]
MKIGLFFGSFNPIHMGHLMIAGYMAENTDLDQVWFMVTPQNPLKNQRNLLNEYDRLEMVNLAIAGNDKLRASDFEFYLPRPSFTIDTLVRLKEAYSNHEFVLIMGSDTVNTLPKWKNHEVLIDNYAVYAYPRVNSPVNFEFDNLTVFETPIMEISATFIRRSLQNGRSIRYFVPESVRQFLEKWGYYK